MIFMGRIYVIIGKSASGKDTICQEVFKRMPDLHLKVTYTTRPMRDGERDGEEYHFLTETERDRLEESGRIIERRDYNTREGVWSYFTTDDESEKREDNYLMIGTLESCRKLIAYYGEDRIRPIYIETDDYSRLRRAVERERSEKTPRYDEVCRRFLADKDDFSEEQLEKNHIRVRFENKDLDRTVNEVCRYISEDMKG
jgi:guanylate kinase